MAQSAQKEIEKLREAIRYHEHRYYVLNDPEISDAEFDKLMKRLEALESTYIRDCLAGFPFQVGLVELAKQLGNVSQACKMMGYGRDSF